MLGGLALGTLTRRAVTAERLSAASRIVQLGRDLHYTSRFAVCGLDAGLRRFPELLYGFRLWNVLPRPVFQRPQRLFDFVSNGVGNSLPPAVPEIPTWSMMLFGFSGLGFWVYRYRTSRKAVSVGAA